MRVEIEIPDDVIPDGYSPIAYRKAMKDEPYLNDSANLRESGPTVYYYLVLRKKPEWPAGFTCRAIAKDRSGAIAGFINEVPEFDIEEGSWGSGLEHQVLEEIHDCSFLDGVEPENSLMVNPNWKAKE